MKVYAFVNVRDIAQAERDRWCYGVCIAANGIGIGSHLHSSEYYCQFDWSPNGLRWHNVIAAVPDAEYEFVPHSQITTHPGLLEALRLNQELEKANEAKDGAK